jgi:hypothetical protein
MNSVSRKAQVRGVWLLMLLVLALPSVAHAQLWAGILHPFRAIDWSSAGIPGGVPNRTFICATLSPGASATQINSAITSCSSNSSALAAGGGVVLLSAGTYSLSGQFVLKSNVTLRGAGADQTKIVWTDGGGSACSNPGTEHVCFAGSFNYYAQPQNSAPWTAGYTKGATQITLGSTAGLSVGQVLILDQTDDLTDTGGLFITDIIRTDQTFGAACRESGGRRCQVEYHEVTGIIGNVVTISPGLLMPNWTPARSPGAWWAATQIKKAGIEDMSLDRGATTDLIGISFFNAHQCWVKGVRQITGAGSSGGRNHVQSQHASNIVIRDSYFYGTRSSSNLSYGVELFAGGNWLVENNMFQHIVSPLLPGTGVGNVYGYNYSIDHYYVNSSWNMPGPLWAHDAGALMLLAEGNQGTGVVLDNIHGTMGMNTFFRNQWTGRDGAAQTNHTHVVEVNAYARYMNFIGNVMGEAGYHTKYETVAPATANCGVSIYALGSRDLQCAGTADPRVTQTLMRWGNYDVVNNAARFVAAEVPSLDAFFPNVVPVSQILPASLYLTAKPWWWRTPWRVPQWPVAGPDVTGGNVTSGTGAASTLGGHADKNPARLCYENMPADPAFAAGTVRFFNAATCYTGGTATAPPSTPSQLTAQ